MAIRSEPQRGVFLPTPVLVTIALAVASGTAAFVFATKAELASHAYASGVQMNTLEGTVGHQAETIHEIKATVKMIDANVRALMSNAGIPKEPKP